MSDEHYRAPSERPFLVGVFEHPHKRSVALMAYTRYYNPSWPGCCEHTVSAISGTQAKIRAMDDHRARCMAVKGPANEAL